MKLWEAQEVADEHVRNCLICSRCWDSPTGKHEPHPERWGDSICVWCLDDMKPYAWMPETPIEWLTEPEPLTRWQRLVNWMLGAIGCR